jgi:hypothetical protein
MRSITAWVARNRFGEDELKFGRPLKISTSHAQKGNHMYSYTHTRWGITITSFVQFCPSDRPDQKETFTFGPGECIKYTLIHNDYGTHIHNPFVCDQKESLHTESKSDADFEDDTMSYMYITYEEASRMMLGGAVGTGALETEHRKQKRAAKKLKKQTDEWKTHRREKVAAKIEARLLQRVIP